MKKSFINFFDKIIVILLFFAGVFSSCCKPDPGYNVEKYGMPVPEYGVQQSVYQSNENENLNEISTETISENIELE